MSSGARILEIGNYPPPRCGWSVRTEFLVEHLRRAGVECQVLNIGPSRRERRPECIDVQGGLDYLWKLIRFAVRRYRFHVHANGDSPKGFVLVAVAYGVGLMSGLRPVLTFHAGIAQRFFPKKSLPWRIFFRLFFGLPSHVVCNSDAVRGAITAYGISREKVHAIPAFTARYVEDVETEASLPTSLSSFLARHSPTLACYAYFRPEFELELLLQAVAEAGRNYDELGLILIGHLQGSAPIAARARELGIGDRILFAGDLLHGQFLAALRKIDLYVRTHTRDGVSSSVLEALALGTPVLACRNESRPAGAVTYEGSSLEDLTEKLLACLRGLSTLKDNLEQQLPVEDTLEAEMRVLLRA